LLLLLGHLLLLRHLLLLGHLLLLAWVKVPLIMLLGILALELLGHAVLLLLRWLHAPMLLHVHVLLWRVTVLLLLLLLLGMAILLLLLLLLLLLHPLGLIRIKVGVVSALVGVLSHIHLRHGVPVTLIRRSLVHESWVSTHLRSSPLRPHIHARTAVVPLARVSTVHVRPSHLGVLLLGIVPARTHLSLGSRHTLVRGRRALVAHL
jgi:hypothetical protein